MCPRSSRNGEYPKLSPILRRSPRFVHGNHSGVENETSADSSLGKTAQNKGGKISKKEDRKKIESKGSKKSGERSRKSTGSGNRASVKAPDLQNQRVVERRVTRSSVCGIKCSNRDETARRPKFSRRGDRKATLASNSATSVKDSRKLQDSKKKLCVVEKRKTRSTVRGNNLINAFDTTDSVRVSSKETNVEVGGDSCKQKREKSCIEPRVTRLTNRRKSAPLVSNDFNVKELCGIERGNVGTNCKRNALIGEKRKRCEVECGTVRGWTKKQELALQKAYFTENPTPHFWKKVAKMVPGKSAEECFDRIHSDHSTPSQQPRTRSRANKSPVSFSASKLLSPTGTKAKKNNCSRRKTLVAQKTVRHLLQKQQKEDQNYDADFFADLEPRIDSPLLGFQDNLLFSSPPPKGSDILAQWRERSSSATKKHSSRINSSQKAAFVSPPVLKQVKNKALHEKYIDQLHTRDAKRKAESLRNSKGSRVKGGDDSKVKSVKFARDALVFEAQDAAIRLRSLQASVNDDDDDDDVSCGNEKDEDELI